MHQNNFLVLEYRYYTMLCPARFSRLLPLSLCKHKNHTKSTDPSLQTVAVELGGSKDVHALTGSYYFGMNSRSLGHCML